MAYGQKAAAKKKVKGEEMTVERSMADFKLAYGAKSKLIERQREDFLFAFGEQWSVSDKAQLERARVKPVTDNRIAPNIYLLTGLERQNRTDFAAFPIGEEDGIKAEIATALFKDAVEKSQFAYKSSDQFKDGITCGESHLELYLDYTESIINGRPYWTKYDGNTIFPAPTSKEYDFCDAPYVYKVRLDISEDDLINLYPEKKALIEAADGGKLDLSLISSTTHLQKKDYPMAGQGGSDASGYGEGDVAFDLIERYYKKYVETTFVGDKKTGELRPAESGARAGEFVKAYQAGIQGDRQAYDRAAQQHAAAVQQMARDHIQNVMGGDQALSALPLAGQIAHMQGMGVQIPQPPPQPPEQDPGRFIVVRRMIPEIWCFAHVPGLDEPLADERAWFYPKWKGYPFVPYFARFSTAPLMDDDRHLLVQGIVHGVKGAQEKHNKSEMLMLRHLNSATNSGWLAEEDSWVDPQQVKDFGSTPGVNLYYKQGRQRPERIAPTPLSQGHALLSAESAESIKAQLGINADLLATQQGSSESGRAIALRQKQGLLMVQELFDNLSRTRQIAGRFLLSQIGEIYDTETAKKVLGEAFLKKNFPPIMLNSPDPNAPQTAMADSVGRPMEYDKDMAELAIAEVLSGALGEYDVSVGESVASETERMAAGAEVREISKTYPGIVPPDVLIKYSQLPQSAKDEILSAIEKAQAAAQAAVQPQAASPPGQ